MSKRLPVPSLLLTLPLPPGINAQYATVQGRRVLTEDARKWKRAVAQRIDGMQDRGDISQATVQALGRSYLSFYLDFYFSSPHKRDLDGGLKITLDAVCEALKLNDNRVVDIHLVKKIDPLRPRLELTLEGIPDWQFDTEYFLIEPDRNDS